MRRLVCEYYDGFSFGKFVRAHPQLRGTVTDLLIGDLLKDHVDGVWQAIEGMYPEGKVRPLAWNHGVSDLDFESKSNELVLPDGPRP